MTAVMRVPHAQHAGHSSAHASASISRLVRCACSFPATPHQPYETQVAPHVSLHFALIFSRLHLPFSAFRVHLYSESWSSQATTETAGPNGGGLGFGGLAGGMGGGGGGLGGDGNGDGGGGEGPGEGGAGTIGGEGGRVGSLMPL